MILGVNGIRLVTPRSGVAQYLENVLRCFAELDHPFDAVRVYVPRPLDEQLGAALRPQVVTGWGPPAVWEQLHLPRAHGRGGVLFCPSYIVPFAARCPLVVVHHGSYEGYAGFRRDFGWLARTRAHLAYRLSARRAARVITVSESSRRDILRFYGVTEEKVRVIPNGVDREIFHPVDDRGALAVFRRRVLGEDAPCLLYVGKPIRRHNVRPMLEAYRKLLGRGFDGYRFLFIGSDLPGMRVQPLVRELGLEDRVTLVGHADHRFVARAMNAAEMLIYASDYEGFGMPVLEGLACGTPVLTLDGSALPEVAGDAALLLPRGDTESLAEGMQRLLTDGELRRRLRAAGLERAKRFDWGEIAARTLEVIAEIA